MGQFSMEDDDQDDVGKQAAGSIGVKPVGSSLNEDVVKFDYDDDGAPTMHVLSAANRRLQGGDYSSGYGASSHLDSPVALPLELEKGDEDEEKEDLISDLEEYMLHESSSDPGPTFSKAEHLLCSALDWSLPTNLDSCIDEIMAAGKIMADNRAGLITRITKLADFAVADLTTKGYFGVSKLLGGLYATGIRELVLNIYKHGGFQPGEHAQKGEVAIRSDTIKWIGAEQLDSLSSPALRILLAFLDGIILHMGTRLDGVCLGYKTRAMLACYSGRSSGYDKHYDNPNVLNDGRYLTCIYYLNPDWNPVRDGGELILWPSALENQEVVVAPFLDRAVFFYSDERTLHQVLPSTRDRFALTVWYFDTVARHNHWLRRRHSLTKIRRTSVPSSIFGGSSMAVGTTDTTLSTQPPPSYN